MPFPPDQNAPVRDRYVNSHANVRSTFQRCRQAAGSALGGRPCRAYHVLGLRFCGLQVLDATPEQIATQPSAVVTPVARWSVRTRTRAASPAWHRYCSEHLFGQAHLAILSARDAQLDRQPLAVGGEHEFGTLPLASVAYAADPLLPGRSSCRGRFQPTRTNTSVADARPVLRLWLPPGSVAHL